MFIAIVIIALLALAAVVANHGPSVYDDLPDRPWAPARFWNQVPRT